jgi:hypothetical protein
VGIGSSVSTNDVLSVAVDTLHQLRRAAEHHRSGYAINENDEITRTAAGATRAPDRAAAVARLEQTRDSLAARLTSEEGRLTSLQPDDPERIQGERYWRLDLLEYGAVCELLKGLNRMFWDPEIVELAVLARKWRDLERLWFLAVASQKGGL